jgi:hypothetical protein
MGYSDLNRAVIAVLDNLTLVKSKASALQGILPKLVGIIFGQVYIISYQHIMQHN